MKNRQCQSRAPGGEPCHIEGTFDPKTQLFACHRHHSNPERRLKQIAREEARIARRRAKYEDSPYAEATMVSAVPSSEVSS